MLVDRNYIENIIPQKQPVVLIDSLLTCSGNEINTSFHVKESCVFVDSGMLGESGLIENIAQTAAAGSGYMSRSNNTPVQAGFIASVKNIIVHALPPVGSVLNTTVRVLANSGTTRSVAGEIKLNDNLIMTCEMLIVLHDTK